MSEIVVTVRPRAGARIEDVAHQLCTISKRLGFDCELNWGGDLSLRATPESTPAELLNDFNAQLAFTKVVKLVVNNDPKRAIQWFRSEKIPELGCRTAAELVADGKAEAVLAYVESISAGPAG